MDETSVYAVIILAAGASHRMGQPKQLLVVDGVPLLRRVVGTAIEAKIGRITVVLGANAAAIKPTLMGLPIDLVVNEAWSEGMGASIRAGMAKLENDEHGLRGVIIALGDQPQLSGAHLIRLVQTMAATGKSIVASRHAGKLSPPVLFGRAHFPALRNLQGDAGARALLQANPGEIVAVDTQEVADIDTPEDYANFLQRRASQTDKQDC